MISIPKIDFHITDSCNFGCQFCCHYSNFNLPANSIKLEQAETIYKHWTDRISPREFIILGGEPTLHPKFPEHLELGSKHWPNAKQWVLTNGTYLDRHPRLPHVLKDTNTSVYLTLHGTPANKPYWEKFRQAEELLKSWREEHGIAFRVGDCSRHWLAFYQLGDDGRPKPFNSDPAPAYKCCSQKLCTILRPDGIYRCATLGLFEAMAKKLGLWDSPDWALHRQYAEDGKAEVGCSDEKLKEVLEIKPIAACSLCPASRKYVKRTDPLKKPLL